MREESYVLEEEEGVLRSWALYNGVRMSNSDSCQRQQAAEKADWTHQYLYLTQEEKTWQITHFFLVKPPPHHVFSLQIYIYIYN